MNDSLRDRIAGIDLRQRLLFVAVVAILYMIASRLVMIGAESFAEAELARTPFRIVAALLFWLAMKDVLARPPSQHTTLLQAWPAGILILLFTACILGLDPQHSTYEGLVLAVTSIPVGFAEELLFRGIIQTLCVKRWGTLAGLTIATALFATYHIGVTRDEALSYALIFLTGLILGAIYLKSGSLSAAILIHTVVDALYSLPRLDVDIFWKFAVELAAAWAALHWLFRKSSAIPGLNKA